jgi:hypothetical protein
MTNLFDVNATHDENITQNITFSVFGGADQSKFHIQSATGRLTFVNPPDFEANASAAGNNAYNVIVRVTDNGQPSAYDEQNITINVVDGFEPAKFDSTFSTTPSMTEDGSFTSYNVTATDQNVGGGIAAYGINTSGANGTASINANGTAFNYVPDGNFTGTDTVIVEVNNTSGLTTTIPIIISVSSIADPPVITTPSIINHPENQQVVADLSATDDDDLNSSLIWSWSNASGNDSDFILSPGGKLSFRLLNGPDYESTTQSMTFQRNIRVTDSDGNFTDGNFTIKVVNVNDNPPLSPFLLNNASSTFSLIENNSTIVDLNASDRDNSKNPSFNQISYSITGGPDSSRFSVNALGRLSLLPAPDFENPSSADFDNIYQVHLTLTDGTYTQLYPLVVTVTDADENAPVITSGGGGADANYSIRENTKLVNQLQATYVEATSFTFTSWGGSDQNLFDVNATTGAVTFITPPNYEVPSDGDSNNLYEVWVRVSDGYSIDEQKMNIRVTDYDELPTVSPSSLSTLEDVPIVVTFTISDPEGRISDSTLLTPPANGTLTWASFPLSTASDVKFTYTPKANFSGTDSLTLRVTDFGNQGDFKVNIEVNATNDAPTANPDLYVYDDATGAPFNLNVIDNDSNAPDANGTELLTVDTWTTPKYGSFVTRAGVALPDYQPSPSFIGVDTFQYVLSDGSALEATGDVTVVVKKAVGLPSWRFSDKVGYYNITTSNWIYHVDLGWLYLEKKDGLDTTTWVWSEAIGWFWTGEKYAPSVYLNDLSGWFTFSILDSDGVSPKRYMTWPIYDQRKKEWLSAQNMKIIRVNTVLSQFDSFDKVIEFVFDSSLFTSEQKVAIKTELLLTGRSSTLESLGYSLGR